ncbi:MAG: oligopeptide transporter, OPT family [Bdellovibrionota bacterium]
MSSKKSGGAFTPYVPASKDIPEVTARAVILGILLGIVLGAANTYLGLYAGMTVSASIPAAVISMGILRGLLKQGTILENNIVQTMASTSESLAAGVIFTVPALILTGAWHKFHYVPATLICITGGLLGILFMIPLRRSHIVEDQDLTFPEGVACAEVLKSGEEGAGSAKYLFYSIFAGALLKFLTAGTNLVKGAVEWAWGVGKTGFYFGTDVSAALLGVGYIIGFNIAALMMLGGLIAWTVALPIMGATGNGIEGELMDWFWTNWSTKIRYMGVGAMIVGGIWSIISIRDGIKSGLKEALVGYKEAGGKVASKLLRTDVNMDQKHILLLLILTTIAIFGLYLQMIHAPIAIKLGLTSISTLAMVVLSFFFVAVASYIVGLVGSSSSPVSGMTICAILATGGLLLLARKFLLSQGIALGEMAFITATLGVAGVVCCATCTAGDISQDLKTGYILGATPKRQQWMEVVAAIIPSLVIVPVLIVLNEVYGIGTGEPGSLKAPQATLFANLVSALFTDKEIPWFFVEVGAAVGVGIIIMDLVLKKIGSSFRMPIMAVAVGIYLPLTLSTPIFIGGIIAAMMSERRGDTDRGTLFASGLIAGEAIIGVVLGAVIYFGKDVFPLALGPGSDMLSVAVFAAMAFVLYRVAKSS